MGEHGHQRRHASGLGHTTKKHREGSCGNTSFTAIGAKEEDNGLISLEISVNGFAKGG
jgi:hypothetical protein